VTAQIIPFPRRDPFVVRIEREGAVYLVICRDHGWLHGSFCEAIADARAIAAGFGVPVRVAA
jgi:hypothetical protein